MLWWLSRSNNCFVFICFHKLYCKFFVPTISASEISILQRNAIIKGHCFSSSMQGNNMLGQPNRPHHGLDTHRESEENMGSSVDISIHSLFLLASSVSGRLCQIKTHRAADSGRGIKCRKNRNGSEMRSIWKWQEKQLEVTVPHREFIKTSSQTGIGLEFNSQFYLFIFFLYKLFLLGANVSSGAKRSRKGVRRQEERGRRGGGRRRRSVTEWNFSRVRLCRRSPPHVPCPPGPNRSTQNPLEGEAVTSSFPAWFE